MNEKPHIHKIQTAVFLLSAALMAYQILLVRIFSIQYWYHFAYFIISIALLGFGASGVFITAFRSGLQRRLTFVLFVCPLFFTALIWANAFMSPMFEFNPLMIIWQPREIVRLLVLSLAIFFPFFTGAVMIGVSLSFLPPHVHRLYFANLTGSGFGCLIVLLPLFHIGPYEMLLVISLLAIGAAVMTDGPGYGRRAAVLTLVAAGMVYFALFRDTTLNMSPFKDLSQAGLLKDAKREKDIFGALGLVTVLDSPAYHYFPDLSLHYPHALPRQKGLFVDGNTVGAIQAWSGRTEDMAFMDYRTTSLAYRLLDRPDVLIIGGGPGTEILNARYHGAKSITVVEMNRDIVSLMQGPYRAFSGDGYNPERAEVVIEDGRGFIQRTFRQYDLIQFGLLESMNAASAGVYGLNENYLFTTEALQLCLNRLKPRGVLSISRWIRNPPRDQIKLVAMAIEAVAGRIQGAPDLTLAMIRSWQTATLLIKNGVFTPRDIEAIKTFCRVNGFDVCYYPGITREETNIFHRMDQNDLYEAAIHLLSPARKSFYDAYPFYIRPASDDRPFFSHFFKPGLLKLYLDPRGRQWIPYLDWGYILVWVTGVILLILAMVLILLPLHILKLPPGRRMPVFVYFSCLGLAYLFLEMSFFQQFIRYLWDPVYAAAVVIGSFLFFSGLGSLLAGRMENLRLRHILGSIAFIILTGIALLMSDRWLMSFLAGFGLGGRMLCCSLMLAPLAIPMGIPFPSGLRRLTDGGKPLIPWAWGINGFFSVLGGTAAVLMAIEWGFKTVVLCALGLYVVAGMTFRKIA